MIEAEENKAMMERELADLERGIRMHEEAELASITAVTDAQERRQEVLRAIYAEQVRKRQRDREKPSMSPIQVKMIDEPEPAPQMPFLDLSNYDGKHAKELAALKEKERVASVNYSNIGHRLELLRARRDQLKAALPSFTPRDGEGSSGD